MQAYAKHQQDDAHLSELGASSTIGDEARCKRADSDAGEQIVDERRKMQPIGK
jgi:hypothetical protein